jgi:hypothetical protein
MLDNPWFALAAWLLSYVADYYLTLYSARLYQAGARDHFTFEGSLELTPYFQADIDGLRRLSPRFMLALLSSVLALELVWYLSMVVLHLPAFFEFLLGGLVLREAAVIMRHARNIALFRAALSGRGLAAGQGLEGQIHYGRRLSLRLSAIDMFSFTALFGLLAVITGSWALAGGGFACAVTALQHLRRARKR